MTAAIRSRDPLCIALGLLGLAALLAASAAHVQSASKISREECIRHKRFDVNVARVCEAAYRVCSAPHSPQWRAAEEIRLACDQVAREQRLHSAAMPRADALVAPRAMQPAPPPPSLLRPQQGLTPPPGKP